MVANIMRKSKAGLINSSALVVMHNATKTMGSDGPSFHSWSKSSKEVLVALRRLEANIETVPAQLHTAQRLAYHAVRKSYIYYSTFVRPSADREARGQGVTG